MMQNDTPQDLVVATGQHHNVREFVEIAAKQINIKLTLQGKGINEIGYDEKGRAIVKVDPRHFRPTEVDQLLGDATKAHLHLGWTPRISFATLISEMMIEDAKLAREECVLSHGKTHA